MQNALPIEPWLALLLMVELLVCSAMIIYTDFRYMIIPNAINLALLAGGIAFQLRQGPADTGLACLAGAGVFASIWLLRHLHFRMTGRIGLGMGDVKLLAVAAVWLPLPIFPGFVFLAAFLALIFAIISPGPGQSFHRRIPFGPFLAVSLVVSWAFRHSLISFLGFS